MKPITTFTLPYKMQDFVERRCEPLVRRWIWRGDHASIWVLVGSCYVQGARDVLDAQAHRKEMDIDDEP